MKNIRKIKISCSITNRTKHNLNCQNFSSKLALRKRVATFIFEIHVFWGVDYESEIRFWRSASEKRFLPNFWHS